MIIHRLVFPIIEKSHSPLVSSYDLTTQMRQKIELFFPIQKFNKFSTRKFYMRHEKGHF